MKKRLLSAALALALSLSLLPAGAAAAPADISPRKVSFVDVKEGDWFYEGVQYTVAKGLFKGVSANRFDPSGEMTRGMVVQTLYALAGKPKVAKTHRFPDVKDGDWFSDAVAWAVKTGVASGYDSGLFGPNDKVTREQLAVMLHGYEKKPHSGAPLNFADANRISGWAKPAMRWAVENKLMSGVPGNRILPQGMAERSQGAVIMMQFDKHIHSREPVPGPNGENQLPIG